MFSWAVKWLKDYRVWLGIGLLCSVIGGWLHASPVAVTFLSTLCCFVAGQRFKYRKGGIFDRSQEAAAATVIKAERSAFELWLPFALIMVMAAVSWITAAVALLWVFAGALVLRALNIHDRLPDYGRTEYSQGFRRLILRTYHAAWWPTYVKRKN